MNMKKRISAFMLAGMITLTSVPISVGASGYIRPTTRNPKVAGECEGAALSSVGVEVYIDANGNLHIADKNALKGQVIRGNPDKANPGADVAYRYTDAGGGDIKIEACSNIKVSDGSVNRSDTFGVIAAGNNARNETASYKRLASNIDQDKYEKFESGGNVFANTGVNSLTMPWDKRGPMSSMDIPQDRIRQCSTTIVGKNDIAKSSDMQMFVDWRKEQYGTSDISGVSDGTLKRQYSKFLDDTKKTANESRNWLNTMNMQPGELRKSYLSTVKNGGARGKKSHYIEMVVSKNCPDDPGKGGYKPNDPGSPNSERPSGPRDCLDSKEKAKIIKQVKSTWCSDTCGGGGEVRGYVTETPQSGIEVGETFLAQYRSDYLSTPKYQSYGYCPNEDNFGWKFWDEEPFNTSIGDQNQTNNYLEYMNKDKKDWSGMNKAWETVYEIRGIADYPNDSLSGKSLAEWLDSKSSYIMTGLPTYREGTEYKNQFEQIKPGVTPPAIQPDSANMPNHPGMSKLEHGWWKGYSSDGKYDINKFHNNTESPIAIEITEDSKVKNDLGTTRFSDQPLGKFKIAWIDRMRGYKTDGSPIWKTGDNITRRCQQKYEALVKYPRQYYKNIIKNGWSIMDTYPAKSTEVCKRYYRGRCEEWCTKCSRPHESTYTVDCYAYKSCQNTKPGDGASDPALRVSYIKPGRTWEAANAELARYMRGDDRTTNMIDTHPSYPSVVESYGRADCKEVYDTAAQYNPGRSWNYRDKVTTEYHGYIVPPTNPDPRFPGIPTDPGPNVPNPNGPPTGENPPGNKLVPFVGKGKKDSGGSGFDKSSSDPRNNYIKSGYGVTYDAAAKFFSDYGRDDGGRMVAKLIGAGGSNDKQKRLEASMIYRPRQTVNIPINSDSTAFDRVKSSIAMNDNTVMQNMVNGLARPAKSSAGSGNERYINDHLVQTDPTKGSNGSIIYKPVPGSTIKDKGFGGLDVPGIEGSNYVWKQKSGMGVTYGTDIGYFHADPKTKLYNYLTPGLDKSRQHFVHLDYPNGVYSVGSIAQIGIFDGGGAMMMKTKMGNYANIEVRGNMYEDSYTAPDNPYLDKTDSNGKRVVKYNHNK